jgi:hypothetical protein
MLILVVGDNQTIRRTHIASLVPEDADIVVFDDTQGVLADLEHYLYPSLFVSNAPVLKVKYMLGGSSLDISFIKRLLASPTVFMFEEIDLPASIVTLFKKVGAIVHTQEKPRTTKKEADIFAVTVALTAPDKKKRWMIYRQALTEHPIEAVMGILYWKVRDLALKNPKETVTYMQLYRDLLHAHAFAWQHGTPLELVIEKVLLTH